jgi:hypothetical protein
VKPYLSKITLAVLVSFLGSVDLSFAQLEYNTTTTTETTTTSEGGEQIQRGEKGELIFTEGLTIEGRLDEPIGLIVNRTNPEFEMITFDRSFMDDILRPIDKEEFEKKLKEKKYMGPVARPLLWISTTACITTSAAAIYMYTQKEKGSGKALAITAGISGAMTAIIYLIYR